MRLDVRPANSRFVTRTDWVVSSHSFSYGPHYDPTNTRFGVLVAHNDDVLAPGTAFPLHPHRDVEIITWVVSGALRHSDDTGASAVIGPGVVQRLSSGSGVRHVESNASPDPTRYLQMWLTPDADGPPSYASADVAELLASGGFVPVVSASEDAPVSLRQSGASLLVAVLGADQRADVPAAPFVHVFVARGAVDLMVGDTVTRMADGDAVRIQHAVGCAVRAVEAAEVLVWAMTAEPPRA